MVLVVLVVVVAVVLILLLLVTFRLENKYGFDCKVSVLSRGTLTKIIMAFLPRGNVIKWKLMMVMKSYSAFSILHDYI